MVSVRRTKNFANDPQTPIFLYTILKQLDLRSINWNEVAGSLGISNGHAARMRYSRMKSQFEGTSNQAKPPKPKKEKPNTADNKSSKVKAKNKRLLEEEENERLAQERAACQHIMQPDHDPKRIKVEPQSYIHHPWYSPYSAETAQMYPNPYWGQPAMSLKAVPQASFGLPNLPAQTDPPTPPMKTEPNTTLAVRDDIETATPVIKQEPGGCARCCEEADLSATIVKREPGTPIQHPASPPAESRNSVSFGYPLSRTINTFFGPQPSASTARPPSSFQNNMSPLSTPQTFSRGYYPPFSDRPQSQSAVPWSTVGTGQHFGTVSTDDACDKMILNPYAVSYQDLLNMPLYRLYPETAASQPIQAKAQFIAAQSGVVEQDQENKHGSTPPGVTSTTATPPPPPAAWSPTTRNSHAGASTRASITPSDALICCRGSAVLADTGGSSTAIPNVIEVDSGDEDEDETCWTTTVKVKKEFAA
ncbi:hypothetical protein AYL99_04181 [Fonsecaea erecta]|uniref:Myb-like DNA-binding domain-containing protein n=1 Tax=Fonsecaea erecta TaxID=1367422 RepID=A0A178ZQ65_9EURO|nr:hypothetical protein AYL99_04181 [Fonsecaea erecta]OAP61978.1 hypothetical protein AYL99_04181 [Fonsecaea erecta]